LTDLTEENKFFLRPSKIFLEQFDSLSLKAQESLEQKIVILKHSPQRNKRLTGTEYFLFRIRFEDNGCEKRAIYELAPPYVNLLCILDRKNNYKDLRKVLEKSKK